MIWLTIHGLLLCELCYLQVHLQDIKSWLIESLILANYVKINRKTLIIKLMFDWFYLECVTMFDSKMNSEFETSTLKELIEFWRLFQCKVSLSMC